METIDIISFLRNYYYISNASLKFKTLSHHDVHVLFPFIKTCRNVDIVDLKSGDIVGVYDKSNRIIYYYNPHLLSDEEVSFYDEEDVNNVFDDSNIQFLSKDELLKIRKKLRLSGMKKEAYHVNKIIREKKKEEPHEYRKRKIKLIKESYYD